MSEALDILSGLVLEDGRAWADAATRTQWQDASEVLAGERPYVYVTRSRGYSKTTDLGGCAVALLLTLPPGSRCYWLASDVDQGALSVDAISGFVQRTEMLRGVVRVQNNRVLVPSRDNRLSVLAADAPSSWGIKPAFVAVDELSQWADTHNARRLWESVSSSALKVPGARMCVITTAGDPRHMAHEVLSHARESPLWRVSETGGPAPWIDQERLAEQRSRLPGSVYEQLFMNVWCEAEGAFLDPEALAVCTTLEGPATWPTDRHRYVAGLDLGHTNDRTVLAIGHRDGEEVVLDRMEVWSGTRKQPVSFVEVESAIVDAHERFRFRLHCDPWQALHVLERLRAAGVRAKPVNFSPQFKQRLASTLLQSVNDRALRLYDDPELTEELLALRVRQTAGGWTFDHEASGHDDRAVALALMVAAALETPARPARLLGVRAGGYSSDLRGNQLGKYMVDR